MGGIEVVEVDDRSALKQFIDLPYALYRDDPYWVPPLRIAVKELLDRKKHPFYLNADAAFFLGFATAPDDREWFAPIALPRE